MVTPTNRPPNDPPDDRAEPIVVGIALVIRDGAILARIRPDTPGSPMPGVWEFPGGKCEAGESPSQAARREAREETGLDIKIGLLRQSRHHDYPHGRVHLHYYEATSTPDSEPAPTTGFHWVPISDLPGLVFPPANESIVDELVAQYARD